MSTLALISLGSNLGDRQAILGGAIAALRVAAGVIVRAVSTFHETRPVGGPGGQGPFLNAAAVLETTLAPLDLLGVLQEIEAKSGRIRTVRWGERTLDLDLLLFGEALIETLSLTVPHPRFALRRFVLAPLAEVAPQAVDPTTGRTVAQLLKNLDRRPSYLAIPHCWSDPRGSFEFQEVVRSLSAIGISARESPLIPGDSPRTINPSLDDWLDAFIGLLSAERWSGLGEQWLVSDFTFSEAVRYGLAPGDCDDGRTRFLVEKFEECQARVVQPTFIVSKHDRLGLGETHVERLLNRGIPRLLLRSGTGTPHDEIAEVIAACRATRP